MRGDRLHFFHRELKKGKGAPRMPSDYSTSRLSSFDDMRWRDGNKPRDSQSGETAKTGNQRQPTHKTTEERIACQILIRILCGSGCTRCCPNLKTICPVTCWWPPTFWGAVAAFRLSIEPTYINVLKEKYFMHKWVLWCFRGQPSPSPFKTPAKKLLFMRLFVIN